MSAFDTLHRFIFANANVRGELVRLDESLNHIVHSYEYPVQIQRLLSEMAAATSLLTATLKFKGEIALQIQSKGPVSYAVINATHDQTLRGVARWDDSLSTLPETFSELLTSAVLVMTITPEEGERYQGVVALEKPTLAECLEAYFTQSEQLATRVHLMTDMQNPERVKAAGVLLQVLPTDASATDVNESTAFSHIATLTETLTTFIETLRTLIETFTTLIETSTTNSTKRFGASFPQVGRRSTVVMLRAVGGASNLFFLFDGFQPP